MHCFYALVFFTIHFMLWSYGTLFYACFYFAWVLDLPFYQCVFFLLIAFKWATAGLIRPHPGLDWRDNYWRWEGRSGLVKRWCRARMDGIHRSRATKARDAVWRENSLDEGTNRHGGRWKGRARTIIDGGGTGSTQQTELSKGTYPNRNDDLK